MLQENPPNLVQNFKRSLKDTTKSTWTTHNKRTQQILVEAFEANQERDLKQKLGICWNFWQIQEHQIYYLCSWSGCSLVHIEQHKWRLLKRLLKLSLKVWNPTDKYSTIAKLGFSFLLKIGNSIKHWSRTIFYHVRWSKKTCKLSRRFFKPWCKLSENCQRKKGYCASSSIDNNGKWRCLCTFHFG